MKKETAQNAPTIPNLDELKQKHGRLFYIKVNRQLFVFRKPNMMEYSLFMKHTQNESPVKAQQAILVNCLVYGDKALMDSVDYFKELIAVFEKLFEKFDVELGEL
jgi:hypothetical protein